MFLSIHSLCVDCAQLVWDQVNFSSPKLQLQSSTSAEECFSRSLLPIVHNFMMAFTKLEKLEFCSSFFLCSDEPLSRYGTLWEIEKIRVTKLCEELAKLDRSRGICARKQKKIGFLCVQNQKNAQSTFKKCVEKIHMCFCVLRVDNMYHCHEENVMLTDPSQFKQLIYS